MHESLAPESPASEPLALDFHHRCIRHTERVSVASDGAQGNGPSTLPSITADGRFVAFESGATNLVPGDTNGEDDIFVHDLQTGETTRVSVSSTGAPQNGEPVRTLCEL